MNNGTYGTVCPAVISEKDVEIYYYYKKNRSVDAEDFTGFEKLDSKYLSQMFINDDEQTQINGMYKLKLPLDVFNKSGIYTIYIRPVEINAQILDVSTLASYNDVRGVIFDIADINTENDEICNNGNLVGYRIEYPDTTNGLYRIITSNNRCEPLAQNLTATSGNKRVYQFNDSSNLIFCTVTPSTAMSFDKDNTLYIGKQGERVKLINTKFNPICIEVEMTEHDIEDVSRMLEGDQLRNLNKGLITTFNSDGTIYHQSNYGNITDPNGGMNETFKLNGTKFESLTEEEENLKTIKEQLQ